MKTAWILAMCAVLVRGDTGGSTTRTDTSTTLQTLLSNHVMSETTEPTSLEDFTVVLDESSSVHLSHLRLVLSMDPHNLRVDPDFNSSVLHFSSVADNANFIGDFKLQNSTTFLSKGTLNVSLISLEVSGVADLLLDENCISVHGWDITYETHATDARFLSKNENGVAKEESIDVGSFLVSFQELVNDEVAEVIKRRILNNLNSVLCSVPVKTLLGREEEEHNYRRVALKPVPYFNEIIDTILENLKPVIHMQGYDILHLPDVNTTFTTKEIIFKLSGTLLAENGSLRNLTSLFRSSDCMLAGNGSFFLVSGGFGLEEFNVTYDHVDATFENIEFTGKLSISFEIVSVNFRASMAVINSTCYPSLDFIHVNKLDNIHVEVEGRRSWVVKDIILVAFSRYKQRIVVAVDSLLAKLGKEYLKSFDCSDYFGPTISYFVPHSRIFND